MASVAKSRSSERCLPVVLWRPACRGRTQEVSEIHSLEPPASFQLALFSRLLMSPVVRGLVQQSQKRCSTCVTSSRPVTASPHSQKGLWNCLSRTPCMLVRYCDILHARAAGVLRGTRSLSSHLHVFASSQGAACQPFRALRPYFRVARECVKHCEDAAHGLDRTRIHVPGRVSCVELST